MALLEVSNLKKSFQDTDVLKGISFSLERGEVLAIIGSSGSGKTTLLRCLNFLEKADSGSIQVEQRTIFGGDDAAIASDLASPKQIRKNRLYFGLVFQSFHLFPQYTVLQNLTLSAYLKAIRENKTLPRKERRKKAQIRQELDRQAMKLLEQVGLSEKISSYPCELSGGQQQRVAIARALMLTPDILCFDEPTSALDPELTKEVMGVIRSLKSSDTTMIVVTHEMDFAKNVADNVIFMANGIIEEKGTPEEVFGHPKSPILQSFISNT